LNNAAGLAGAMIEAARRLNHHVRWRL